MKLAFCHPERTREGSGLDLRCKILRGIPLRMTICAINTLVIMSVAVGCGSRPTKRAPGYFGPTEPMAQVVAEINANNARVGTLWAHLRSYEINFVDDKGQAQTVVGDSGTLMYRKPHDMKVSAMKPGVTAVFNIGSNRDLFWLLSPPDAGDALWWGNYRNAGKPCLKEVPIRPDLLIEVLGISDIDTDFTRDPMPVMTFNNDSDAYIFLWQIHSNDAPARLVAIKEVWYDRKTKLPQWVKLFDPSGRVVLRAWLRQHVPVKIEGVPEDQWPRVASDYQLLFPESHAKFSVQLEDVVLRHDNFPNDRSFAFNPASVTVSKKIQVDENCGP
jgi:hypothetical protein